MVADGDAIRFEDCTSLTFVVAAGTDYAADHSRRYRGDDPHGWIVTTGRRSQAFATLFSSCLLLVSALPLTALFAEDTVHKGHVGG